MYSIGLLRGKKRVSGDLAKFGYIDWPIWGITGAIQAKNRPWTGATRTNHHVLRWMAAMISPTLGKRHSFLVRAAVVGSTLAGISAAQNLVPFSLIHWQFVLQRLYYLPIILAALLFGWRGGIIVAALSGLSYARSIISASNTSAYDLLDVNLEVMVFCVMGVMTGILADREYRQKRALQETTKELSRVYRELQENFDRMKRTERLMCGQGCCTPSREQTAWVP